ncbi:hypothetical protein QTP86_024984 [Hemibagrus guttatus]|nr:hypothetical protein QTP86_024984 [Hemibagrus guttatus]
MPKQRRMRSLTLAGSLTLASPTLMTGNLEKV